MPGLYMGSPGYTRPSRSFYNVRPPSPPAAARPTPKSFGIGGGIGGGYKGGGMPTYRPPAARAANPRAAIAQQGSGEMMGTTGVGATAKLDMPPAQQYNPNTYGDPNLGYMADQGKGLMDPGSEYYKRLSSGMAQQIGSQAQAGERAALLRGAYSGLGGGMGAEVMQTQADIGRAGMEAQGQAEAGLRLQAPMAGAQMLQSTFNPQLGYNQLNEGGRQFGAGLAEQSRQFGVGAGLQQQQMANQMALAQAQMEQQANMFNAQQQSDAARMQWQAMMNQMAQMYG